MCNIVGYETKSKADKDKKIILADFKRYGYGKTKRLKSYQCHYCGLWHLTSKKTHKRKGKAMLRKRGK